MNSEKVIARDNDYVLHTYNRNPIVIEKGHGLHASRITWTSPAASG